jgi:hypothetical protein
MSFETPDGGKAANAGLLMLEAEERYARERYQLYKAKAYGPRLTSAGRLRELERRSKLADSRLDRARAQQSQLAPHGASADGRTPS